MDFIFVFVFRIDLDLQENVAMMTHRLDRVRPRDHSS